MTFTFLIVMAVVAHTAITWVAALWRGRQASKRGPVKRPRQPRTWPLVSVLIPAWQERGTIERCVGSLQLVDYPSWEVVIVAGGTDGTYRAAIEACEGLPHFQVIEQQPRGKNAALNDATRVASGQVIVLLDADSRVSPEWLRELVAPLDDMVGATVGNPVPLRQTPTSRNEQMERIAAWSIQNVVTLQGCGSIAIRRETIEELGGFPEEVLVGVDWDLNARLAASDIARVYCAHARVCTERPATLREYWRNELRWRRAHLTSLFRLRAYFLSDPMAIVRSLYLYLLAWFSVLFAVSTIATALLAPSQVLAPVLLVWAIFFAWLTLRRAALAMEVAAYTRQARWLAYIWVPPLLLWITFVASCVASLSMGQARMHFKGPRTRAEGVPSL